MPARKFLFALCSFLLIIFPLFVFVPHVSSDELDDITKQLNDLNDALNKSVAATKPLQSELTKMQNQITGIKNRVVYLEEEMAVKKKEIDNGYKELHEKQDIIALAIRQHYIKSYTDSPLLILLSINAASEATQALMYERARTNQDKEVITNAALAIIDLEKKKAELEQEQKWLISTKAYLDDQSAKLDKIVKGALAYQQDVSGKIAQLSAKQQEILNARSGGFTATIGDSDQADDYNASINGFRASAPGGYFAVFSFGAYTHRKGMSQYGAFGRAKDGQNVNQILKAYYGKEPVGKDTGGDINVSGFGSMNFEDRYLMGIAEMPSTWPKEALKAQAIAARTYAYRYKTEGREICTTEACQVYNSGKADNPPQAWKEAVQETRGQILEDVVTYYSSTTGGWVSPLGWDTTDGQGGSSFADRSYEKKAGSPWFYKAWYRQGYSNTGDTCGKSNPWLSPSEMADIVNAYLVITKGDSSETGRVTPITTSCWGGNPYSVDELRSVASKYGGISSATSVSVTQGNGTTNNVTINGISMSGSDFQKAFNLRASGYLRIPQSGFAFFNVEKK